MSLNVKQAKCLIYLSEMQEGKENEGEEKKKKRKSIIETVKSSIEYFMRLICHERTKL